MSSIEPAAQSLANVLPDGILLLDPAGKILWWNLAAKELLGINSQQHNNATLDQLIPKELFEFDPQQTKAIEIKLTKGRQKRIALSLHQYLDNQYLLLAKDTTHVHHLEKMRQDFLANVSHELRTPLTVVHGYLETLMEQEMGEQINKIFKQMYQQSVRMETLVNDLLLLSRLEDETPEDHDYQQIFIAPLLQNICNEAKELSGDRQHEFQISLDQNLNIIGLERELESAFSNLIFNAVKYTPPKGKISITWQLQNDRPTLTVQDTGIGIEAKHIGRLTERFYRVDRARSRTSGGTGLGLAIVKHVLIRHNAHLEINSEIGKGSEFICVFTAN